MLAVHWDELSRVETKGAKNESGAKIGMVWAGGVSLFGSAAGDLFRGDVYSAGDARSGFRQ